MKNILYLTTYFRNIFDRIQELYNNKFKFLNVMHDTIIKFKLETIGFLHRTNQI